MAKKYKPDLYEAYNQRLQREQENLVFKKEIKNLEKVVEGLPTFDTEDEALNFAVKKEKENPDKYSFTIWTGPKELGDKWKVEELGGLGIKGLDLLGWTRIYTPEQIWEEASKDIDHIDEI